MKDPLEDWQIPRFKPGKYVRLLSHGELETAMQFENFCKIAEVNYLAFFTMWTKRRDLVEAGKIPKNLRIIYSSLWIGKREEVVDMKMKGFTGVFTVYEKREDIPEGDVLCEGKRCRDCMHCYSGPVGKHIGEVKR